MITGILVLVTLNGLFSVVLCAQSVSADRRSADTAAVDTAQESRPWHELRIDHPVQELAIDRTADSHQQILLAGGGSLTRLRLRGDVKASTELLAASVRLVSKPSWKIQDFAHHRGVSYLAGAKDVEYGFVAAFDHATEKFTWRSEELDRPVTRIAVGDETIVVTYGDGSLQALRMKDGEALWHSRPHAKMVTAVDLIGGGLIASGDWTGKIVISDLASGEQRTIFSQHRDCVTDLQRLDSPEGASNRSPFYSGSTDGTVRLWYAQRRRLVRFASLDVGVRSIARAGEDTLFAATRDGTIRLLNMLDVESVAEFPAPTSFLSDLLKCGDNLVCCDGSNRVFWVPISDVSRH